MRQGYLLSSLLFNLVLDILARATRQETQIKGIPNTRDEVKLSLFIDNMILYTENPKEPLKKLLELINKFSKFVGTSCISCNEQPKNETKKTIPFTIASKIMKCLE